VTVTDKALMFNKKHNNVAEVSEPKNAASKAYRSRK